MSAAALFEAIPAGDLSVVTSLLNADPALASAKNDSGVSATPCPSTPAKKKFEISC